MDSSRYLGIFCREAEELLQTLRQGLVALEGEGCDGDRLRSLLRTIHTFKGSARLLNLSDCSRLAHALEDRLKVLEKEQRPLDGDGLDRLLGATEALAALVAGVAGMVTGEVCVDAVIAGLAGGLPVPPSPRPQALVAPGTIESLRTDVAQLDRLVNQLGEVVGLGAAFAQRGDRLGHLLRRFDRLLPRLGPGPEREALRRLREDLGGLDGELERDLFALQQLTDALQEEALALRMLPLATIGDELEGLVRSMAREQGKTLDFVVSGGELELDRRILEMLRPMLVHLLRNAVDHGIESAAERSGSGKAQRGRIELRAGYEGGAVQLVLSDDGRGLDPELLRRTAVARGLLGADGARALSDEQALYLILKPGFSTREQVTDHSGRGIGMDAVKTVIDQLKGNLLIGSEPGRGTAIVLQFPLTLAVIPGLLVACEAETFVVPLHYLVEIRQLSLAELQREGGRAVVRIGDLTLPLVALAALLDLPRRRREAPPRRLTVLVLNCRGQLLACQVCRSLGVQELVVKSLGEPLRRPRFFTGATLLANGLPALILSVGALFAGAPGAADGQLWQVAEAAREPQCKGRILVVDDSITTRTLEKNILETRGYRVTTAISGEDALVKLATEAFDLVVSDVEMPGISGFELTEKIRGEAATRELPVIIVTSFAADADKRRGLAVGAQAYIVKGSFDQGQLLQAVETFIG